MISSTNNRNDYTGTGSLDTYAYTFRIFAETDLVVTQKDTSDVETTLILNTDYTVTGVGDATGGNIVLTAGNLASGYTLTIRRVRPLTQLKDIRNGAETFPATYEDALDHAVMIEQQQQEQLERAVKLPVSIPSADVDTTLPVPVAGEIIGWNDTGDGFSSYSPVAVGTLVLSGGNGLMAKISASELTARTISGQGITVVNGNGVAGAPELYLAAQLCGGRITADTNVPVPTADQTAVATLFYRTCVHDFISLYDGTKWEVFSISANGGFANITVPAIANKNYDIFFYSSGGKFLAETVAWTNDSTRAVALATQDGVLVKTGDATRRYIGTFRTSGVSQTEDSAAKRFVWNYYNRVQRSLRKYTTQTSWAYTTATFRQFENDATNQIECVIGVEEDQVEVFAHALAANTNTDVDLYVAIGSNGVTQSANCMGAKVTTARGNGWVTLFATLTHSPSAGYKYYVPLEASEANGTTTWYGSGGADINPAFTRTTGIYAEITC